MGDIVKSDFEVIGRASSTVQQLFVGTVDAMPTASGTFEGICVLYLGETTKGFYYKGTIYKCIKLPDGKYRWRPMNPGGDVQTVQWTQSVNIGDKVATIILDGVETEVRIGNVLHDPGRDTQGNPYYFGTDLSSARNMDTLTIKERAMALGKLTEEEERFIDRTLSIPSADIANDKAGLYNKTLANAKQDLIRNIELTIPHSGWGQEGTAAFKRTITAEGIKDSDNPIISIRPTGDIEQQEEQYEAASHILSAVSAKDEITFTANAVPDADIPIFVRVL